MRFKTDRGGLALQIDDAKLSSSWNASTWSTRLSQINRIKGKITICTYSLPSVKYIAMILGKRPANITLVVNEKFRERARKIQRMFPRIEVHLRPNTHAKMVLIEPDTVWLSSANFGQSGWFEQTIGLHSKEAYEFYEHEVEEYLRRTAKKEQKLP